VPFDFTELIAALAARRVFVNAQLKDGNFQWRSVDRVVAAARPVFAFNKVEFQERLESYQVIESVMGKP
jgi:hypothetical protein